jgi:hypothetical protein
MNEKYENLIKQLNQKHAAELNDLQQKLADKETEMIRALDLKR